MPMTGAGWVGMQNWLGLNADAGKQMQQNAIAAANQNAQDQYGGRFSNTKHAQQGTAWNPQSQQALVHGSMWDAGLLGQQNQGQAGGHMQTAGGGLGSDFTGQPGAAGGPKMTKWTTAQTQGTPMQSYATVGGQPANPATMTTGATGQASGTGAPSYSDSPSGTSLEGLLNWLSGHGDRNRNG